MESSIKLLFGLLQIVVIKVMGISDTAVAQTSSVTGFVSAGYASTGYADATTTVPEASASNIETGAPNSGEGNEAVEPNQAAGYDSSVNGGADMGMVENGDVSENVAGAGVEQQYVDGSGMFFYVRCNNLVI